MGLQAVTELLDRLGADAIDAQQILLGLANQVADRLDANLAELVGPALRHAQIVEQVQTSLLGGDGVAVAGERTVSTTELVVAGPVELLRELLVQVLELHRSPLGQRLGVGRSRAVDVHVAVGRAIRQLGVGVRLRPVPAGIFLPTMTLDLRSSRWSTLPSMAASVRTPAVRMNEALDSQESMLDATLSVPRMTGSAQEPDRPDGQRARPRRQTRSGRRTDQAGTWSRRVGDLNATQHLACEHLDVLVVQVDALAGVDVLDALDEGVHRRLDVGQLAQVAEVDEALVIWSPARTSQPSSISGMKRTEAGTRRSSRTTGVILGVGERQHVLGLLGLIER